ncbi:MAG: Lactaldehyde dehydrogenase [Methanomassiliicoccales archaeon PtaU1.Bin124]|nr:MAG: Lactaldehyde dehydrogenase [Methanomassiliicoccales archaeon PtaU1.Bin124]
MSITSMGTGIAPTGDKSLRIVNPATLLPFGDVQCHSPDDIGPAMELSRSAQAEWAALPLSSRISLLQRAQDILMELTPDIVRTICHETGKPRIEAMANDVMAALSVGDYAIEAAPQVLRGEKLHLGRMHVAFAAMGRSSYIQPRPVGVVGIVSPWNYPFGIPYSQTAMALAAGNSVIIKPSSYTPFSAIHIADIFAKAGVPKGLVQTIIGSGGTLGSALVRAGPDRLIFTGSGKVGREILTNAVPGLTPVTLELSGKDPLIVLDDADLSRAARAAVWGSFVNAGQTCAAVKRILVHEKVLDQFNKLLLEQVSKLRLGWGWDDPEISMGPLINGWAANEVDGMVSRAVSFGAKIAHGGKRPSGLNRNFYEPTIITDVDRKAEVSQGEIFGPLVVVLPFTDPDDAIEAANDCIYALAGSIWTNDLRKGRELAGRMPGGSIIVNNVSYSYGLGATPWGGSRESGFGRTHGDLGFAELVEAQHIHVDKGGFTRDVWWSPYGKEGLDRVNDTITGLFGRTSWASMMALLRVRRSMKK